MEHDFPALMAMFCVFSVPLLAIWTHHKRKVLEMQLQLRNQGDSGVRADLEAVKQELRALRDTSTQYDLSFDTALQRMERRVEAIERSGSSLQSDERLHVGNGR